MQSWLDRRHEVLSNEDFGSSLDAVERLLVQHGNMRNTIDQFLENLNSLSAFAAQMKNNKSKNSIKMSEKYEDIQSRMTFASSLVDDKLKKLHESQLFFDFLQQANRVSILSHHFAHIILSFLSFNFTSHDFRHGLENHFLETFNLSKTYNELKT